ncbi:RDD family protein [Zhouia sp. PK063]|uniref:RDD family protein n=1 Tax=Zhouia sp. PK063 TaxID=3373602 RepID=UPI00379B3386
MDHFENFVVEKKFGTFWERTGALIIDGLIIGIVINIFQYALFTVLHSFIPYLILSLLGILYKPFLEYKYGATIGKMAFKLKVVDVNYNAISFETALYRNILQIIPSLLRLLIVYLTFQITNINTISYIDFLANSTQSASWLSTFISILDFGLILAEIIVLVTDDTKRNRALHDRIAKTLVIKLEK